MGKRWFRFIYPMALTVGVLALLSKALKRYGAVPEPLVKGNNPAIWIHAVSVGETRAVATLAKLIHEELPYARIVVSSITETGHEEAKRSIPFAHAHVFLPLDFAWVIRRWLRWFKPDLVLVAETDFWYQFLRLAKESGAGLAVVNGKISERSTRRYQHVPWLSREIFGFFDGFCVQSQEYAERLARIGIANDRLYVTGNTKLDCQTSSLSERELAVWRENFGIKGRRVVVAGSTHDPEEKLILGAMKRVWAQRPEVKLLLVPRHPARFDEVAGLLKSEGISFVRWSQKASDVSSQVVLIDAMGLLRTCYQLADIAIVAGSFVKKVGGHNILEPADYAVPVIFGPHIHSQPEMARLMLGACAAIQASAEELECVLLRLLENESERRKIGLAGLKVTVDYRGATERTWIQLKQWFKTRLT